MVSPEVADQRCASGEWMEEDDLLRAAAARFPAALNNEGTQALTVAEMRARREPLIEALRSHLRMAVVQQQEQRAGFGMPFRTGQCIIYKLGPALRETMPDFLSIVLGVLTASNYFVLLSAWTGFAIWRIVKALLNSYEPLKDPVERIVFETLFKLSGQLSVVNYTALKNCDYDHAYDYLAPTTAELLEACGSECSPADAERALEAMKAREILKEESGRWWVRL
jgi:hypothetical protein